eukprot:4365316-Pyramimonas_sp.AAC.1
MSRRRARLRGGTGGRVSARSRALCLVSGGAGLPGPPPAADVASALRLAPGARSCCARRGTSGPPARGSTTPAPGSAPRSASRQAGG